MKVVFYHRKPTINTFSVEGLFRNIRDAMPKNINCIVAISKYQSQGIFKRVYNIIDAFFRQGDINHITGDVHYLSYLLRKKKTLLTVLDCGFTKNTSGVKKYLLWLLWYYIPEKRVSIISVISNSTKIELFNIIKCNPAKIRVVPVCISPEYQYREKIFNAKLPIILQVGTGRNKNIFRLLEAISGIPCHLVLVGILSNEHIQKLNTLRIQYSNYVNLTEDEMVQKYYECDLVTFVSTYEGFGMPILEANAVGRPVITSNAFSMPEVAGNAACIVDPYNVYDIKSGIMRIINDDKYRYDLISNGVNNNKRFNPEIIAKQYAEIYDELMRED